MSNLSKKHEMKEKDVRTTMTHLNTRLQEKGLPMEIIPKKEHPGGYRIRIKTSERKS